MQSDPVYIDWKGEQLSTWQLPEISFLSWIQWVKVSKALSSLGAQWVPSAL